MRSGRVVIATLGVALALLAGGCGGSTQPHVSNSPVVASPRFAALTPFYARLLHWSGITVTSRTGYLITVNGTQVADVTASPYTVDHLQCGQTYTIGVQAHDNATPTQNTSAVYSTTYMTPACPTGSTAFNDPLSAASIATGPNQWTVVDNTLGNDNATFQCDRADHAAEGSGALTETLSSGSFTCPGPTAGNGGITSCPGGTCSTTKAGAEMIMRNQAIKYGTVTITAKVAGDGSPDNAWPALWMLGPNCQHPQLLVAGADPPTCSWHSTGSEEVDIAEWTTGVRTSFACSVYSNTGQDAGVGSSTISDASSNFHTYELDWTPSSLSIKTDGSSACTLSNADAPTGLEMLVMSAQMNGNTMPTQPVNTITSITVAPAGPDITSSANWPAVTGSTTHGSVLSVSNGTWTGSPTGFTYRWLQCNSSGLSCNVISGATSSTYTTVSGDIGHTIQAEVTATNASGATQYGSNLTAPIT